MGQPTRARGAPGNLRRVTSDHVDDLSPATLVVAAGRPGAHPGRAREPARRALLDLRLAGRARAGEPLYGRMDAATWHPFEETLGTLEGSTHPALVFGSGMAAIAAALSLVPAGRPAGPARGTPTR